MPLKFPGIQSVDRFESVLTGILLKPVKHIQNGPNTSRNLKLPGVLLEQVHIFLFPKTYLPKKLHLCTGTYRNGFAMIHLKWRSISFLHSKSRSKHTTVSVTQLVVRSRPHVVPLPQGLGKTFGKKQKKYKKNQKKRMGNKQASNHQIMSTILTHTSKVASSNLFGRSCSNCRSMHHLRLTLATLASCVSVQNTCSARGFLEPS